MGKFIDCLSIKQSRNNCKMFYVSGQMEYHADNGDTYKIVGGWESDGLSYPLKILGCPIASCRLKKGLLHDILYGSQIVTRKQADTIFAEPTDDIPTSWMLRKRDYLGVRIGGIFAWNSKKEKDIIHLRKFITIQKSITDED